MFCMTSLALCLLMFAFGADNATVHDTVLTTAPCCHAVQVRTLSSPDGDPLILCAAPGDDDSTFVVATKVVDKMPKEWIGVRLTPVPAPLAAHLGREGLMIANVVEDSPADRAGLERYDVVVSFNGKPLAEMSDLQEAISEAGAGQSAQMVVIHAGKEKTLEITPTDEAYAEQPKFKYEEPEAVADEPEEYFWGHRLRSLPDGKWIMEPHGRLDALPERIKKFLDLNDVPDMDWGQWSKQLLQCPKDWSKCPDKWSDLSKRRWRFRDWPFGLQIEIGDDEAGPEMFWFGDVEDQDLKGEISIEVSEDGKTVEIHRAKDGKIEVERKDADGHHSSATYEGVDQLREKDEEAYRLLLRYASTRATMMMCPPPEPKKLGERQYEFQKKLQRKIEEACKQYERALDQAGKARKQIGVWKQPYSDAEKSGSATLSVKISVDKNGHITVELNEDGAQKKYEFDSREDFKQTEPELYDRFEKDLEGDETGAASE